MQKEKTYPGVLWACTYFKLNPTEHKHTAKNS